jgi:pyridoxal phosphate enzyme (YggS family)
MNEIAERIAGITKTLPAQVALVAVSKTKPVAQIMAAYAAGQRDFGENYVQELCDKAAQLPKDIRWHFIGHLQSNKVKYIAPFVHLIHSVDSLKLLKEIDRQAHKNNRVIDTLLQIYIATEETKFGMDFKECEDLLNNPEFTALKHVKVIGMMAMSSNTDDVARVEAEFARLKHFYDNISNNVLEMQVLSMGMSGDYPLAVKHGSTMIRVGSSIFGGRG